MILFTSQSRPDARYVHFHFEHFGFRVQIVDTMNEFYDLVSPLNLVDECGD